MSLHQKIHAQLLQLLAQHEPSEASLNGALRLLAKHRSALIQNTLVQAHGVKVLSGPFVGMEFLDRSAEGCHVPKLLGCYEEELHDVLRELPQAEYDTILNIGCAEGYYAVGIKRLAPRAHVLAYDINPAAQEACRALAAKNNVDVEVGAEFLPKNFAQFAGQNVLVWCDIEGAEVALLDPERFPILKRMDLVVELHLTSDGHAEHIVPSRFAGTHSIDIRESRGHTPTLPAFLRQHGHLDQLLAQWEWRSTPTPWAVMRANRNPT